MNKKMEPKFEIFSGKDNRYYFRLSPENGKIVLTSEGYASLSEAKKGVAMVKLNAGISSRFEKRMSQNQQSYFVLLAKNGEIVGTSETYKSSQDRDNGIRAVKTYASEAKVEVDVKSLKKRRSIKESKAGTSWLKTRCANYIVPDDNNYPSFLTQLAAGLSKNLHIGGTQNIVIQGHQAVVVAGDQCVSVRKNQYHSIGDNQIIGVEGDQVMQVLGTQQICVAGGQNLIVDGNQQSSIGGNQAVDVDENYNMSTGNNLTVDVGKNYNLNIVGDLNVDVGNNYKLEVGKKIIIDCGDELILMVGKSRVTLKKNGYIEIFGNIIDINSTNELNLDGPKVRISGSLSLTLVGTNTMTI